MDLGISGCFWLCHSWSTSEGILIQTLWPLSYYVNFLFTCSDLEPRQVGRWRSVNVSRPFLLRQQHGQYGHLPLTNWLACLQLFCRIVLRVRQGFGEGLARVQESHVCSGTFAKGRSQDSQFHLCDHRWLTEAHLSSVCFLYNKCYLPSICLGSTENAVIFLIVSIKMLLNGLRSLGNRNLCFPQNTFPEEWSSDRFI